MLTYTRSAQDQVSYKHQHESGMDSQGPTSLGDILGSFDSQGKESYLSLGIWTLAASLWPNGGPQAHEYISSSNRTQWLEIHRQGGH